MLRISYDVLYNFGYSSRYKTAEEPCNNLLCCSSRDLLLLEVQEADQESPEKSGSGKKWREKHRQVDVMRQESDVFTSSCRQPSEEHKQNEMNERVGLSHDH